MENDFRVGDVVLDHYGDAMEVMRVDPSLGRVWVPWNGDRDDLVWCDYRTLTLVSRPPDAPPEPRVHPVAEPMSVIGRASDTPAAYGGNELGFPLMPSAEAEPVAPTPFDPFNGIREGDVVEWATASKASYRALVEELDEPLEGPRYLQCRCRINGETKHVALRVSECTVVIKREDL